MKIINFIFFFVVLSSFAAAVSWSGLTRSVADTLFINDDGDTMTGDLNIGTGGYSSGGITLTTDGGAFVQDLILAGNITKIGGVEINGSLVPASGVSAALGNSSNQWASLNVSGNAYVGSLTSIGNISTSYVLGKTITPIVHHDLVNKEYVDDAVSSTAFDFFFNNQSSDIGNHFNMTEADLEFPESTLTSASLSSVETLSIFNWTTLVGQPEFNELRKGVYDVHIHASKSGSRSITLTPKLYNISSDGINRNLLVTFETSSELTTSILEFDLHGVLADNIMLNDGDRLNLELEATIGSGSSTTVIVTLEGTTDSHLSIETSTNAFEKIFVRRDGTNELTGNWNVGSFDITAQDIFATSSIGIGTTNPAYTLTVAGNLNVSTTMNVSGNISFTQLISCDTINTDDTGLLTCGSDAAGAGTFSNFQYANITQFLGVPNSSILTIYNLSSSGGVINHSIDLSTYITNAVSDLVNYFTQTEIFDFFQTNITSANASIKNYVDNTFVVNTGDDLTGNYNHTSGEVLMAPFNKTCYGWSCEGQVYYNGSSLVIKVT